MNQSGLSIQQKTVAVVVLVAALQPLRLNVTSPKLGVMTLVSVVMAKNTKSAVVKTPSQMICVIEQAP